jgi:predicted SAM-dependent methyltransferase
MRYLNLGCGQRFHPDWENLDFLPTAPGVRAHDLRKGIPFPDSSFDVVYHSHLLEHFSRQAASQFLKECHRVLISGGVLRAVVPDLERIALLYLKTLDESLAGDVESQRQYEWIMLEMYDQTVRASPGGQMFEYLRVASPAQIEFVRQRHGAEIDRILETVRGEAQVERRASSIAGRAAGLVRRKLVRLLLGVHGLAAYDHGRFRFSGEIHNWMYDRYSLAEILRIAGFVNPGIVGPAESRISNWVKFALDTETDGRVYKPDSLFMEAVRP